MHPAGASRRCERTALIAGPAQYKTQVIAQLIRGWCSVLVSSVFSCAPKQSAFSTMSGWLNTVGNTYRAQATKVPILRESYMLDRPRRNALQPTPNKITGLDQNDRQSH